ncbi:type VI secretion system ATPase TssH [Kistimonas scapharcae]|uniref:Type VI secretion system ATPase TssH n=1 Tax=Kistimonas scapharcae TaxID=1036133 RepID=A0ABP8UVE7_9GAMM
MQSLELKTLISKLDPSLRKSLESAAGLCVRHQHRYIEIEHWLLMLFSEPSADIETVINSQKLSRQIILSDLEARLARLEKGDTGTPSLSMSILALIQDAWLVASVNCQHDVITAFDLLLALLQKAQYTVLDSPMARELQRISLESLQAMAEGQGEGDSPAESSMSQLQGAGTGASAKGALYKYTVNLTDAARNGELRPIIGRQKEIRQVIDILSRQRQNNPILVGDPGVGKTAIVEGLAQRIITGEVPESMKGVALHTLDLGLLQAGASIRGELESRLKDLMNEVRSAPTPVLLFIDEAHTLIGAGGTAGQNDAANLLKPALARGELRTIGATTWAEYKKYFEKDAALARRFQLVKVLEPDEKESCHIVRGVARSLEAHHDVRIHDDAVVSAVKLAIRYLPEQQLPDKAISLLDTACSRVGLSRHALPEVIEELEHQYAYIERELNEQRRDRAAGHADLEESLDKLEQARASTRQSLDDLYARWKKERVLVEDLAELETQADSAFLQRENDKEMPVEPSSQAQCEKILQQRKELEQLQQEQPMVFPRVDSAIIASILSSWTGIPINNMLSDEIQRLLTLESHLTARVIGQDDALKELCQCIRTSRAGLSDRRKPSGVFLMCGPSGVGKTETALALAEELFGGEQNLTTLNMTEFKEEHKISQLLGSPAGYVGYGEGGLLTEAVRRKPYSVLLLDEMEKSHPGVHDIFYQIFDRGCISDSEGREVNFCNSIIIMTSNAADYAIMEVVDRYLQNDQRKPTRDEILEAIQSELLNYFKPAFLGRVVIVPYLPLGTEDMRIICRLALERIRKNVADQYKATLTVSDAVVEQLVAWNNNPLVGARAIEQLVNRNLLPRLSVDCLKRLTEKLPINHIDVSLQNHQLVFDIT